MISAPQTNLEIRVWYNEQVARICTSLNEEWKRQELSAETRAYKAWEIRHEARLRAREMMPDKREVRMLEERDRSKYGNITGPTFEDLVVEIKKRHPELEGNAVYEKIIELSCRTNPGMNKLLGL